MVPNWGLQCAQDISRKQKSLEIAKKSLEIIGNGRKSSEVIGKGWERSCDLGSMWRDHVIVR